MMLRRILALTLLALPDVIGWNCPAAAQNAIRVGKPPRVAGVVSVYHYNSHADMLVGRVLAGHALNGQGQRPFLKLEALFTDQVPENDLSRAAAKKYGFPVYDSVRQVLAPGQDGLAVQGVLLVAEHGMYPSSKTGSKQYPKRRLFGQIADVFESTGRVVPVFCDKHLADNWTDAKWLYDRAVELHVPMMAGSSIPSCRRQPATDVKRGAKLTEIVGVSFGSLDSYGFHGLEMVQCLAERRAGGETGVARVQCLSGDAVWDAVHISSGPASRERGPVAGDGRGLFDEKLLHQALARLRHRPWKTRQQTLREAVKDPVLFVVDYRDGLRVSLLTLNGAVSEWSAAWSYADGSSDSTLFKHMEVRPYHHFTYLLQGIETMIHTGRPTWPVERTLLTSGILDAALISRSNAGRLVETPYLNVSYRSGWDWNQPPELPPNPPVK